MNQTFPAAPATYLIEAKDGAIVRTVIVGWCHVQGTIAFPVTVLATGGVKKGQAIEHPDGYVSDPVAKLTFTSVKEWQAAIDLHAEADDGQGELLEATEEAPDATEEAPDATGAISFGGKVFKQRSFWHMPNEGDGAIFVLEGGVSSPDDERCVKITGAEYKELKASGATEIDPSSGEIDEEPEEESTAPEIDDEDLV